MRIFAFKFPAGVRYIDLEHVQEMSALHGEARPAAITKDKDGIDVHTPAYGSYEFWYRLAFQEKELYIKLSFDKGRYHAEYEKLDAYECLMLMKTEYERMLAEWLSYKESAPRLSTT